MKTVRDLMTRDVVTVERDSSVRDLVRLLVDEEITGAPVVDTHGEVVGVVSTTDVLQMAAGESFAMPYREPPEGVFYQFESEILPELTVEMPGLDWYLFEERIVGEIMNPVRYSIGADATLPELADYLLKKRIHRALVLEDDELAGIVTTFDVLRGVAERATIDA